MGPAPGPPDANWDQHSVDSNFTSESKGTIESRKSQGYISMTSASTYMIDATSADPTLVMTGDRGDRGDRGRMANMYLDDEDEVEAGSVCGTHRRTGQSGLSQGSPYMKHRDTSQMDFCPHHIDRCSCTRIAFPKVRKCAVCDNLGLGSDHPRPTSGYPNPK